MTSVGNASLGRLVFVGTVHEAEPALSALIESPIDIVEVLTMPVDVPRSLRAMWIWSRWPRRRYPVRRTANINAPRRSSTQAACAGCARGRWMDQAARRRGARHPPRGCIGFHASLLPRFRGRAPVNWAILRGEAETGNTMMYLNAGTDTGDVIDQRRVTIDPADTCVSVYTRVAEAGATMLRAHLEAILDGTAPRRRQERADSDLLRKRTPAKWASRLGIAQPCGPRLDLRTDCTVPRGVRSLGRPQGDALGIGGSRRHRAEARPGEVIGPDEDGVRVGTADGSVLVTAMSIEGSAPQAAFAWAREHGMGLHDRFEDVDEETARWVLGLEAAPVAELNG